jgi:hypothetical protein
MLNFIFTLKKKKKIIIDMPNNFSDLKYKWYIILKQWNFYFSDH